MEKAGGKMKWRILILVGLFVLLTGTVIWQQIYTDTTMNTVIEKAQVLSDNLMRGEVDDAPTQAKEMLDYWHTREVIVSLFVDYRDIEQIGRQADYVLAYVESGDWELARVECEQLLHVTQTFANIVSLDWQNII